MISIAIGLLPIDLASRWRSKAELFREHEERSLALAYEKCARELEDALDERGSAALTLAQAAEQSGYSADHLGRLVREGKIPNAGRPGAPKIRVSDLPNKVGAADPDVADEAPVCEVANAQIVQSIIEQGE